MPHRLTVRARGSRPVHETWERFVRPAIWPRWAPQITATRCRDERVRRGLHGLVRAIGGIVARFRVDAVDDLRMRWAWTVRAGRLLVRMEHGVERDGDGSAAWARIHAPLPLAALYAPVAALALRRLVGR